MKIRKLLPFVGIVLFVYILVKIDLNEVFMEIRQADIIYLLISILFLIFMLIVGTFKWHVIALKQDIKVPFWEAFKINIISDFYGFVTPSKFGSIVRADYLKKYTNDNIGKGLFNFTLDKILDIASLFVLSILFAVILSSKIGKDQFSLPIGLFITLFAVFVLISLVFINKKRSKFILRFFYRRLIPEKMKNKVRLTFDSFYESIPKKRYFVIFFLLNLISWINVYAVMFCVGKSLEINLPFFYFLAILPIGTLIAMIPITVNGFGTREASLIKLFGFFGIGAAKVFSMSLINIFISGILPSLFGGFLIFKKKWKK